MFNIINMNARLYDPTIGRMLAPDNYVSFPGYTQSHNRYTYALNNPLKYTDPTGNHPLAAILIGGVAVGYSAGVISSGGELWFGNWESKDWMWAGVGFAAGAGAGYVYNHMHRGIARFINSASKNLSNKNNVNKWTGVKHAWNNNVAWQGKIGIIEGRGQSFIHNYFYNSHQAFGISKNGNIVDIFKDVGLNIGDFNSIANDNLALNYANYDRVVLDRFQATMFTRNLFSATSNPNYLFDLQADGTNLPVSYWSWSGNYNTNSASLFDVVFQITSGNPGSTTPNGPMSYSMRISAYGHTGEPWPMVEISTISRDNYNHMSLVPWRPGNGSCPPWMGGKWTWSKHEREYYKSGLNYLGFFRLYK